VGIYQFFCFLLFALQAWIVVIKVRDVFDVFNMLERRRETWVRIEMALVELD
jgi:hypothetical protein